MRLWNPLNVPSTVLLMHDNCCHNPPLLHSDGNKRDEGEIFSTLYSFQPFALMRSYSYIPLSLYLVG